MIYVEITSGNCTLYREIEGDKFEFNHIFVGEIEPSEKLSDQNYDMFEEKYEIGIKTDKETITIPFTYSWGQKKKNSSDPYNYYRPSRIGSIEIKLYSMNRIIKLGKENFRNFFLNEIKKKESVFKKIENMVNRVDAIKQDFQ